MLEYVKTILSKVSFDPYLFEKELKKSVKHLISDELPELQKWCYNQFGDTYLTILNKVFIKSTKAI